MKPRVRKALGWAVGLGIAVAAVGTLRRFPWEETGGALLDTDFLLLTVALLVNLNSLIAKGWAWQLLLRPVAPIGWWGAQRATLTGTALTYLSTGVVGEAARARSIVRYDGTPWQTAVTSIIVLRLVEGIGFAIFVVLVALAIDLPPALRVVQIVAAATIVAGWVALRFRGWGRWTARLPSRLRHWAELLGGMVTPRQLPAPVALAVANWVIQWATYALTFRATHIDVPAAGSMAAVLAANVAGLVAVTPGNVGVFQASIVVGLLPFGVPLQRGILAGLVLQAIQVLPVLGLAVAMMGLRGLRQLRRQENAMAASDGAPNAPPGATGDVPDLQRDER